MPAKSFQLCPILCHPMEQSSTGSSVQEVLQAGILEWVAMFSSRSFSPPRDLNSHLLHLSHCQAGFLPLKPPGKSKRCCKVKWTELKWSEVAQSCLTLCDPVDCSLPGSSAHGILHARILEWVAISFSRGSSRPKDWTCISCIADGFFTVWATKETPYWCKPVINSWSLILSLTSTT